MRSEQVAGERAGDGQVDDLGDLPPDRVAVLAKVGAAVGVTGFAGGAAIVAADDAVAGRRLHKRVEGRAGGHVGKPGGGRVQQRPVGGLGDNLGELAARDVVVGAEVGPV